MKFFVKAVLTGFALSLGAALYKKVAAQLGLADDDAKSKDRTTDVTTRDGASDPGLHQELS